MKGFWEKHDATARKARLLTAASNILVSFKDKFGYATSRDEFRVLAVNAAFELEKEINARLEAESER